VVLAVMRIGFVVLGVLAVVALSSEAVAAHQLGTDRFDAPLPLAGVLLAGGLTVGLSAVWLAIGERTAPSAAARPVAHGSQRTATAIAASLRWAFFILFALALWHGLTGPQATADNLATLFVWSLWLEGVGLLSMLAGSPWPILSPWRALYDLLTRLEDEPIVILGAYPSWLGDWPALLGFGLGLATVENLTRVPRSPRLTAVVVAGYTLWMLAGGIAFGTEWFRRADVFTVFYRLLGRVSPLNLRSEQESDGWTLELRWPWVGATETVSSLAVSAFVIAAVFTISFDGAVATRPVQSARLEARQLIGLGQSTMLVLYVAGLGAFLVAFLGVCALGESLGAPGDWRSAACAFAPTVIPITAGYEIAHNYTAVIRVLEQSLTLATAAVPGVSARSISLLGWLSLPVFWWSQLLLIVGGHVVAVVAAHLVALRRYETADRARRAHLPLGAVMVGYTMVSLWIVSRPVVS